jgi:hypothetical protein
MKTPRDILLQRHKAIEPKLDAIRRHTLASLERPGIVDSLREFVFALRWHLAGLSAVWIAVLLLNIASAPDSRVVIARGKTPTAQVLLEALLKNRRELLELTEAPATGEPAALPPRRSELQTAIEMV